MYSHANSPLRKAASTNFLRDDRGRESLGGQGERRLATGMTGTPRREGSPLKRVSMPSVASRLGGAERRDSGRF